MAFAFSVNALEKETKKTINYKKKNHHTPMQRQKIVCSPSFAVTLTQSWTRPDLVMNMTAHSL